MVIAATHSPSGLCSERFLISPQCQNVKMKLLSDVYMCTGPSFTCAFFFSVKNNRQLGKVRKNNDKAQGLEEQLEKNLSLTIWTEEMCLFWR